MVSTVQVATSEAQMTSVAVVTLAKWVPILVGVSAAPMTLAAVAILDTWGPTPVVVWAAATTWAAVVILDKWAPTLVEVLVAAMTWAAAVTLVQGPEAAPWMHSALHHAVPKLELEPRKWLALMTWEILAAVVSDDSWLIMLLLTCWQWSHAASS